MKNVIISLVFATLIFTVAVQSLYSKEKNKVDSYDVIEQRLVKKEYDSIAEYYAYPVTIRLGNFKKLRVASIIPVYTEERGWVRAQFLERGDKILFLKNEKVKYVSILNTSVDEKLNVFYTFVNVQDTHTYFKDGVLVHNKGGGDSGGGGGGSSSGGSNGDSNDSEPDADVRDGPNYDWNDPESPYYGSNPDNQNDGGNDSGGSDGPSPAQVAAQIAQAALDEAIEAGASYAEIEELIAARDEAEEAYQSEVAEQNAIQTALQVGDPVLVTSGIYIHEESDMLLEGSLSTVNISRTYTSSSNSIHAMGRGWASILDSRIIRGTSSTSEKHAQSVHQIMQRLIAIQDRLESKLRYRSVKQVYELIGEHYDEINAMYQKLLLEENTLSSVGNLNKYVVNKNTPIHHYAIGVNNLNYITEDGSAIVFKYVGAGLWKPLDVQKAQYMKIKSRDEKDSFTEKGFIVYDKGGIELWFDKWGLLEKKLDKNGNEVLFKRNPVTKKLITIKTPEGRSIHFDYNAQGFLKTISAPEGKTVSYEYAENNLISITDIYGDKSSYDYNGNGLLTRYTKPDNSYVSFTYGLKNSNSDYLTTSTTNEEGFSEHFEYDTKNKYTVYTSHSGFREYVYYDNLHRTIKKIDKTGIVTEYTYDDIGNLSAMKKNGNTTQYTYDARGNKILEQYSDGSKKKWAYNLFDQVTIYTDRDGKKTEVVYDVQGNPIEYKSANISVERAVYDIKGNIIKLIDSNGNITSFMYDEHYNVVRKTNGNVSETFEYDGLGRLTTYIDGENRKWTYEYKVKTTIEISPSGLQRVYEINNRKDLVRLTETDLFTNETRIFEYEYDRRHLLEKILQNDKTLVSYSYYPSGELKSEAYRDSDGFSWVTEYELFSASHYSIHKRKFAEDGEQVGSTYTETLSLMNGGKKIVHSLPLNRNQEYTFDAWDRLIEFQNLNGEKLQKISSFEGRVIKEQSNFGGWYESVYNAQGLLSYTSEMDKEGISFAYNPNGSLLSKRDQNGSTIQYVYDPQGNLIQEKKENGSIFYTYDAVGRLTRVVIGRTNSIQTSEQYTQIAYTANSRSIVFDYGGIYSEILLLNAWGEVVERIDGKGNIFKNEYNGLGQVVRSIDAYNTETVYAYNAIGKISKIMYTDGNEENFLYNNIGKLERIEDSLGIVWQGMYDEAGRLIQINGRNITTTNYTYDALNRVIGVNVGGLETERYTYSDYGKNMDFIDGKGNEYTYTFDSFGRLVKENNRLGYSQQSTYDSAGQLVSKTDFNKGVQTIVRDYKQNTVVNNYSDNSKSKFTYNIAGLITEATNETGRILYTYNKAGMLESQIDEGAGESTVYSYDKAGRRKRYVSGNRDVSYSYGKNGELLSVIDNSQRLSVKYAYDAMMREVSRTFANGITQYTMYDEVGRVLLITEKNTPGEIIRAEGYVYNKQGQIQIKVDENAFVTKYEYDMQGRLAIVYYPFNEDKVTLDKNEGANAGLFFTSDMKQGELLYLSNEEVNALSMVLNMVGYARSNSLRSVQTVWKESYTYDENSNRLTKTTAWGTVQYEYDKENRLTHSGVQGRGTNFEYDANGNLLLKSNAYQTEQFMYNGINRMATSIINNTIQNTQTITHYGYDAFARRNMVKNEGFTTMRTLYDGQSHDIIKEAEVFFNGAFTSGYGSGIEYRFVESASERYLFVDKNRTSDVYKSAGNSGANRFIGVKVPLYAKGEIVGVNYSESSHTNSLYFGKDILGSIRSASQNYAELESRYEYDAFGSPYEGNFISGLHNGYTGKPYDAETELYNYGFRDYSPQQARFTTVDPIRDGNNWFNYVAHDPVNFIDLWGLSAVDIGNWIDNGDGTFTAQAGAMLWQLNATGQNWTESDYVGNPEDLQIGQTVSFGQPGSVTPLPTVAGSVWDNFTGAGNPYEGIEASTNFQWPLTTNTITSSFGPRDDAIPFDHQGIDLRAPVGTPTYAVSSGIVTLADLEYENSRSNSSYLIVDGVNGFEQRYVHMDSFVADVGKKVKKGELIGYTGDKKNTAPHLHFELRRDGIPVDPELYLP